MFSPTDILDRELYFKKPTLNKMLKEYISLYGKNCIFYINPNHESSENDKVINYDLSKEMINNQESHERFDNYTIAYGKDQVGYDYSKLDKFPAKILAEYKDYFAQNINAEESVIFYLQVENTPISRGDIISYIIQDKQVFYRITDKIQEFYGIAYRVTCKLIQAKDLQGAKKPYDLHEHKPTHAILPDNGIVL